MSHALHRIGNKENLNNDYTIIVRPERGYNNIGSRPLLQAVLQALYDCKAINITSARGEKFKGNIYETTINEIIDGVKEGSSIFAAFDNKENLEQFLQYIIVKDYGLSIVVQGLYDNIKPILEKLGLKIHSTNHSIGIWGKTEMLHSKNILEITTMCGHGIVSPYLVQDVVERIRQKEISIHEGAVILSKPCICGIFNTTRAEYLLKMLI